MMCLIENLHGNAYKITKRSKTYKNQKEQRSPSIATKLKLQNNSFSILKEFVVQSRTKVESGLKIK